MEFILKARGGGKTRDLLDWLEAAPDGEGRVIVSYSSRRAMELLREAREAGRQVESWQFVGVDEVRGDKGAFNAVRLHGRRIELAIDDLDLFLPRFFAWPVAVVTATPPERGGNDDGR